MSKFTICIDENSYYTTTKTSNLVDVKEIPCVENAEFLKAYKYDGSTESLILDEDKLAEIKKKIAEEEKIPSDVERLNDLENAFMELSEIVLGGN